MLKNKKVVIGMKQANPLRTIKTLPQALLKNADYLSPEAEDLFVTRALYYLTACDHRGRSRRPHGKWVEALTYRFGLDGKGPRCVQCVAKHMGLSIPVVSRHEWNALFILRKWITVGSRAKLYFKFAEMPKIHGCSECGK